MHQAWTKHKQQTPNKSLLSITWLLLIGNTISWFKQLSPEGAPVTVFISKMTCNMMGSSGQAQCHNQSCSLSAGHCILTGKDSCEFAWLHT